LLTYKVKWLGHAAFQITSGQGTVILVDPWITGNPMCPVKVEDIKKADLVLVTHDHFDHMGSDIPAIIRNTEATLIAQPEVAGKLRSEGVPDGNIVYGMGINTGGSVTLKGITVTMTQAFHSSGVGSPCGYLLTLEDGKTIYHSGDTSIFSSMQLLGEIYQLDLALIPVGGTFTMDALQAATALTLLKPKTVIPMHYKTFPILVQDTAGFVRLAKEKAPQVVVKLLDPGQEALF